MSWIDERLSQAKARQAHSRDIEEQAPVLYDALWRKIFEYVEEAKTKGFDLMTNGAGFRRVVKLPASKFILEMPDSLNSIAASGDRVNLRFLFNIGKDGVVSLKAEGLPVSIDDAATLILDRFLFPDFH